MKNELSTRDGFSVNVISKSHVTKNGYANNLKKLSQTKNDDRDVGVRKTNEGSLDGFLLLGYVSDRNVVYDARLPIVDQ